MELTSPLSTLPSISTPESYQTARGSPSNAADETSLSSPVDEPPPGEEPGYRDAVQLPHELKSHCQIHLEEQLYTAAIHILSGLLGDSAGTVRPPTHPRPDAKPKPVRVPPPSQIALLATLVIHPSFTSRAPDTGNKHAAAHALAYLRGLLSIAGPVNANFRAAFDFHGGRGGRAGTRTGSSSGGRTAAASRNTRSRGGTPDSIADSVSASGSDDDAVGGPFAESQLVFRRAPDFWALLGWAFRCAAEHPRRWRHWRVWLELAVAVLEADFDERLARDREAGRAGRGKSPRPYPLLLDSLLVGYLDGLRRERRNVLREVMRALFAFSDGENAAADRAVFREVFDRETAPLGKKSKRKRGEEMPVLDLENDGFGDYLDDGDELDSEADVEVRGGEMAAPKTRRKPGRKPKRESAGSTTAAAAAAASFILADSFAETVPFRLRIFRLLSATAEFLPDSLAHVGELYERFTTHVRGLPLPAFRLFVQPAEPPSVLPEFARVSVLRMVAEGLLPPPSSSSSSSTSAAARGRPDPADVEPLLGPHGVSVPILRECFLPFAAARVTAEDNAKLSLALESLAWLVYSQVEVEPDERLRAAIERGIRAREDKIRRRGGGAAGGASGAGRADVADKAAREALARSSRNLRALVDVIDATAEG